MSHNNRRITLLDTRSLMLRDYHSSEKTMTLPDHTPVATWQTGLATFIERTVLPTISASESVADIIAVWDGGNSCRQKVFPDYKRKRLDAYKGAPDNPEIRILKDNITRLLAYLGIKSVHVPEEEADDLIALFVDRLPGCQFTIRTLDNDLLQLVSDRVSVWVSDKLHFTGEMQLETGYRDVPYSAVRLYKALVGDTTDGYGGVKGLGEAAFKTLLSSYGEDGLRQIEAAISSDSLQYMKDLAEHCGDKTLLKLANQWDEARLGLYLAALHPEACYGATLKGAAKKPTWYARIPNRGKVLDLLTQIGLPSMIRDFEAVFPSETLLYVHDSDRLQEAMKEAMTSPVVSFDYESSDKLKHEAFKLAKKSSGAGDYVDVLSQEIAGVSINYGVHRQKTIYVPFDHSDNQNYSLEWMTWILKWLETRSITDPVVVQNANFELTLSKLRTGFLNSKLYDTAIMASYVDENLEAGLKSMSLNWLGYRQTSYAEVTGGRDMCNLTAQHVLSYGCDDSLVTSHLFDLFWLIMNLEGSWEFYSRNEVQPAVNDVLDFIDGQEIDYDLLSELEKEGQEAISSNTHEFRALLAKNVSPVPDHSKYNAAVTLFTEWWDSTKHRHADKSPEQQEAARIAAWEQAYQATTYIPFTQTIEVDKFSPTPVQISRVFALIAKAGVGCPSLKKASGPGVDQFIEEIENWLLGQGKTYKDVPMVGEFVALIYEAKKYLGPAKRTGSAYALFEEFCQRVLEAHQKGKEIISGDKLDFGSGKQMQALLYGKMGLPIRKRSKVARGSTREKLGMHGAAATGLKAIAAAFVYDLEDQEDWRRKGLEAYSQIILARQNYSLYFRPYPLWKHPMDGRIHPQIRNCGTVTRRPSGRDPNILQVSKKGGGKIRRVFVGGNYGDGEERVVVSADFASQELVITACESKDPVMLDAFMHSPRKDLHSLTCTGFAHIILPRLGIPCPSRLDYETFIKARKGELGDEMKAAVNIVRNKYGKPAGFLIAYGGGASTLAGNILISKELAEEIMQGTFSLYSRIIPWQQETAELARKQGYVETAYGNRRHASKDLWSTDNGLRKRQERQMVNASVQSTAADILKIVRQQMYERDFRNRFNLKAVKPVYDEITASVPVRLAADYAMELAEVMAITPPGYPVGMAVELSVGKTWGGQTEVGEPNKEAFEKALNGLFMLTDEQAVP